MDVPEVLAEQLKFLDLEDLVNFCSTRKTTCTNEYVKYYLVERLLESIKKRENYARVKKACETRLFKDICHENEKVKTFLSVPPIEKKTNQGGVTNIGRRRRTMYRPSPLLSGSFSAI